MKKSPKPSPNMADSACQQKGQSCAACCGLYNLSLSKAQLESLLLERTKRFQKIPKDYPASEMVAFRQDREAAEAAIPRRDPEVYVCPFLGFLDIENATRANRPGCLAHPLRTGKENTQNFSFYGASICQTYDCRTKEEDTQLAWSELCAFLCPDFYDYGRLYADYAFYKAFLSSSGLIENLWKEAQDWKRRHGGNYKNFPDSLEATKPAFWESGTCSEKLPALYCLCHARLLCAESEKITSFELDYLKFPAQTSPEKSAPKGHIESLTKNFLETLLADAIGKTLRGSDLPMTQDRIATWIRRVFVLD